MEPTECGIALIELNSTNSERSLSWPTSSSNYRPNSKCDWTIEVPAGEQIDIHFEKFELEDADSEGQCSRDLLRLTDEDVGIVIFLLHRFVILIIFRQVYTILKA